MASHHLPPANEHKGNPLGRRYFARTPRLGSRLFHLRVGQRNDPFRHGLPESWGYGLNLGILDYFLYPQNIWILPHLVTRSRTPKKKKPAENSGLFHSSDFLGLYCGAGGTDP